MPTENLTLAFQPAISHFAVPCTESVMATYPDSILLLVAVTVVVISRLVYRKGVDLMAQVIADICPRYPQVGISDVLKQEHTVLF